MRKVLCVIVIIAMIITIIPACSFAAEKELLNCSITNNKPRAGDEIAVKVKFSNLKDAMSIEGYININERVFEPISTESIAKTMGNISLSVILCSGRWFFVTGGQVWDYLTGY